MADINIENNYTHNPETPENLNLISFIKAKSLMFMMDYLDFLEEKVDDSNKKHIKLLLKIKYIKVKCRSNYTCYSSIRNNRKRFC